MAEMKNISERSRWNYMRKYEEIEHTENSTQKFLQQVIEEHFTEWKEKEK